jgi:hypothetical protein
MRKSYQKMLNLTDDESWSLKNKMQLGDDSTENKKYNHIGIQRARRQAREFCLLRQKMYKFQYTNQMKELSDFIQVINFNIFTFKNEVNTTIQNMKNDLTTQFETIISLKMQELRDTLKDEKNQSTNQIKKMILDFNTENKFNLSNTSKIIKHIGYAGSSLVSYSPLPPLPDDDE